MKGEGNQQNYGMRVYDPRFGKFLSVDPISSKYPGLTPYQFASNRPIDGIDLDGLEFAWAGNYLKKMSSGYSLALKQATQQYVKAKANASDIYDRAKTTTQRYYSEAKSVIEENVLVPADAVLSAKFEVKASFGTQVAAEVEVKGNALGFDLNAASATFFKYSAEQQQSDNGPTAAGPPLYGFRQKNKKGETFVEMNQGVSIGFGVASLGTSTELKQKANGYEDAGYEYSGAVGLGALTVKVDEAGKVIENKINIVKGKIALGVGVEFKISFGKTTEIIKD